MSNSTLISKPTTIEREIRVNNWTRGGQPKLTLSIDSTTSTKTTSIFRGYFFWPLPWPLDFIERFYREGVEHFERTPLEEVRLRGVFSPFKKVFHAQKPFSSIIINTDTLHILSRFFYFYYVFLITRCLILQFYLLRKSEDDKSFTETLLTYFANFDVTFELFYVRKLAESVLPVPILLYVAFLLFGSLHATFLFFNCDHRRLLKPFGELLISNYDRFMLLQATQQQRENFQLKKEKPQVDSPERSYVNAIKVIKRNLFPVYRDRAQAVAFPYLSGKLYAKLLLIGLVYELSYVRFTAYSQLVYLGITSYRLFSWPTSTYSYLLFFPVIVDTYFTFICFANSFKLLKLVYLLGRVISLSFSSQLAKLVTHLQKRRGSGKGKGPLHPVLQQRILSGRVRTVRRLQVEMLVTLLRFNKPFSVLYFYWLVGVIFPVLGGFTYSLLYADHFTIFPTEHLTYTWRFLLALNSTSSLTTLNSSSSTTSSSYLSVQLVFTLLVLALFTNKSLYTVVQVGRLNARLRPFYPLLAGFQARQGTYYTNGLSKLKAMIYIELLGGGSGGKCAFFSQQKPLYALSIGATGQAAGVGSSLTVWMGVVGFVMMVVKCGR